MALEHDLELVPVLNKIDLPSADPDEVAKQEVEDVIGLPCHGRARRSPPRLGLNVDQVLERCGQRYSRPHRRPGRAPARP